MKKGSNPCGLYIRINADGEMDGNLTLLRQLAFVINRSAYEKNMHVIEITEGYDQEKAGALVQLVKMEGMVAVVKGSAQRAADLDADGVLLDDAALIADARAVLGEEKIIGLVCRVDRAKARQAVDMKADYVVFGLEGQALPPISLFQWWSVLTEMPAVACGPISNDDTAELVRAGASFLDATDYIKNQEKGVMQGTINMLYAIDLAMESISVN